MSESEGRQRPDQARYSPAGSEQERLLRYYTEATQDYASWSRRYHMHFGYWRRWLNPLRLEPMLDEMSSQVFRRLAIENRPDADPEGDLPRLLDLGCGLGTTARVLAVEHPRLEVDAVTLVPWQIEHARELAAADGVGDRVRFVESDYRSTPFDDGSFAGAYAIESACHAPGLDKIEVLREAARVLAPGARLVVADGFVKGGPPTRGLFGRCYRTVCDNWALDTFAEIHRFRQALSEVGFEEVAVEDASFRIAPSVAHTPAAMVRFFWRELRRSRLRLGRVRWGHLEACALAPLIGMARWRFGYYLITAVRV